MITELRSTSCHQACKILSLCAGGLHLISLLLFLLLRLFLLRKDLNMRSPRRLPGTRLISTLRTLMRGRNRDFDSEDCRTLLALALSGVVFTPLVIRYVVHAHCSWPAPLPPTTTPSHKRPSLKSALRPPPSAWAESANFRPFYVKRADFSPPPPATKKGGN